MDLRDHIHMLVSFKPALSIEQVVRRMKMLSTHKLWASEPKAVIKHFRGSKKRLWSGGYFVYTVGCMDTDATTAYIRNQTQVAVLWRSHRRASRARRFPTLV